MSDRYSGHADPNRCERGFVGNTIGQANAVSDKVLDLRNCAYQNADLRAKVLSGALMSGANYKNANLQVRHPSVAACCHTHARHAAECRFISQRRAPLYLTAACASQPLCPSRTRQRGWGGAQKRNACK
jgi:hypothetical protein